MRNLHEVIKEFRATNDRDLPEFAQLFREFVTKTATDDEVHALLRAIESRGYVSFNTGAKS